MTLSEKSAYLKGLMEGMKLDTETNEGKLISEIISMLQDVAENVSDLEEVVDCISDELDCIEEDLDNIDEYLLDDEDDDEDDEDEDEKPRDTWATVRRLWSEAAGDHWRFYIVFASIVFYAIFNTCLLYTSPSPRDTR